MHSLRWTKKRTLRGIILSFACLVILTGPFVQGVSAGYNYSIAQAATAVPGHWELVDTTTRDTFYPDWDPGSSWYPSPGSNSGGGTIIDVMGSNSVRVETSCSWSAAVDMQTLMPGETLQLGLTVNTTVTGLTPAANLAGSDSLTVSGFGAIGKATAKYAINGESSKSSSGSGNASLKAPAGSPGQRLTVDFACTVDAGMGTTRTDWVYEWTEGPTATPSATPTISPTKTRKPTITRTPTITKTPTITPTPTVTPTPTLTPTPMPFLPNGGDLAGFLAAAGISSGVLGALLGLAGALAILIDLTRKGGKPVPAPIPPEPPEPTYLLSASRPALEVSPQELVGVMFTAQRISPDGIAAPAVHATIQVFISEALPGLAATPSSGMGSLECVFSVPRPEKCASGSVLAKASVAGKVVAITEVRVSIVPFYDLQLRWEDPQQPPLQPDGKAARALAIVTATPPDLEAKPDELASRISTALQGPNSDWISPSSLASTVQEGVLWIPLAMVPPAQGAIQQPGNPTLTARFQAGRQDLQARLVVELASELTLDVWAAGKKLAEVPYNEVSDPPGWVFGALSVFFHTLENDEKPVAPSFKSNITAPDFVFEPDILELRNYEEHPGAWYSGDVALREGVDLEKDFGPDLNEANAQVKLTVKVSADNGKVYTSTLTYQICPTVELVICQGNEDGSGKADKHTYKDNELSALQFVADAVDNLVVSVYLRRTDWPLDSARAVRFGALSQATMEGALAADFKLGVGGDESDDDAKAFVAVPEVPGRWYTWVRSKKPLLLTSARQGVPLSLNISGALDNAPAYYRAKNLESSKTALSARQDLVPLYLYLKLWVIPGKQRETSTVAALTMIVKSNGEVIIGPKYTLDEVGGIERAGNTRKGDRVVNANVPEARKAQYQAFTDAPDGDLFREPISYPLELNVLSDGLNITTHPLDKLDIGPNGNNPCPTWLHAWKIWYKGLNWNTVIPVNSACFTVQCRIADSDEAVSFTIDVGANLKEMWAAFESARPGLDLDNPEIHGASPFLYLLSIRKELFGWWYDLRNFFIRPLVYAPLPPDDPWERYLCAALTQRILNYFIPRRMGINRPETALKMNGIEFLGYAVFLPGGIGYHSWAGMYLSGSDPLKDAIYMDPWWNQKWDEDACKDDYGYKKQLAKFTLTAALVADELILIGRAIVGAVQLRAGLMLNVPTLEECLLWLGKIVANLAVWTASVLAGEQFLLSIDKNLEWKGCFEGESRYENNNELRLFEAYKNDLLGKSLPPINPEKWAP